jgi:hypothetical protein
MGTAIAVLGASMIGSLFWAAYRLCKSAQNWNGEDATKRNHPKS